MSGEREKPAVEQLPPATVTVTVRDVKPAFVAVSEYEPSASPASRYPPAASVTALSPANETTTPERGADPLASVTVPVMQPTGIKLKFCVTVARAATVTVALAAANPVALAVTVKDDAGTVWR